MKKATLVSLLVGTYLLAVTGLALAAETEIVNSVNVTASGGSNHASVQTTINGEVVEDWSASSTEPIHYTNSITSDPTTVTAETSAEGSKPSEEDQLRGLLTQLKALISLYVSLLTH